MKKMLSPRSMKAHQHTQHIVMVCVTRQKTSARLIQRGEAIAREKGGLPLHVVHFVRTGDNFLGNPHEGEALEYLFTAAQLSDAALSVLRADDVEAALCDYAKAHHAAIMVLGAPPKQGESRQSLTVDGRTIVERLQARLPQVEMAVVE